MSTHVKKTILCIENDPKELEKAKSAVEQKGYLFQGIIVPTSDRMKTLGPAIESSDGVITDLFFNPFSHSRLYRTNEPPVGIMLVIHSIYSGVPVVVCSRMYEKDSTGKDTSHHGEAYAWIWDFYLRYFSDGYSVADQPTLPFGIVGNKDWNLALQNLIMIAGWKLEK